jgi:hypothetical protein
MNNPILKYLLLSSLLLGPACSDHVSLNADAGTATDAAIALDLVPSQDATEVPDAAPQVDSPPPQQLTWTACDTGDWSLQPKPPTGVECAIVEVPLDHDDPASAKTQIKVARQRGAGQQNGEALFFVAGGPGASSIELSGIIPYYLPGLEAYYVIATPNK